MSVNYALSPLTIYHLNKWVKARLGWDWKVVVDPTANGASCCYKTKTVTIPLIHVGSGPDLVDVVRGDIVHEVGHGLWHVDLFDRLYSKEGESLCEQAFGCINMMADVDNESRQAAAYAGDHIIMCRYGELTGNLIVPNIVRKLRTNPANADDPMIRLLSLSITLEQTWNTGMLRAFAPLFQSLPETTRHETIEIIADLDLKRLLDASVPSGEIFDIGLEVFKRLWPNQSAQQQPQPGDGEGEGDPGEGEEQGQQQSGEGNGQGKPKKGQAGEDGEGQHAPQSGNGENVTGNDKPETEGVTLTEVQWAHHDNKGARSDRGMKIVLPNDFDSAGRSYIPATPSEYTITDYTDGEWASEEYRAYDANYVQRFIPESAPGFANRVRQLVQVRSAAHYKTGYRSGRKLHTSRLWRTKVPPQNGGLWNQEVFKQKKSESEILDVAILQMVDWSGSMAGDKAEHACRAAILLNNVFSNTLHVPVSIMSFSCMNEYYPTIGIIKRFDQPVSEQKIAERFCNFDNQSGGNNDADALTFGYDILKRRPEKRKIMIVMSDGSPVDANGSPIYALKTVTDAIESEGIVELYGVGMMDTNVKRFYKNWKVIKSATGIEQGLIELLRDAMFKRG